MIARSKDPTNWHRKPKGQSKKPCTVCGLPCGHYGTHRAATTAETERTETKWYVQRADGYSQPIKPYSPKGRKIDRPPTGPTKRITGLLSQAAAMCAMGKSLEEAANALGVKYFHARDWQGRHPQLWQIAYDRAIEKVKAVVLAQMGTDAVLHDPAAFIAMATRCDDWARSRGETLIPATAELTLPRFYEENYRPMCLADAKKTTIDHHRGALRRWALLMGDPPVSQVTNLMIARFRDCLMKMRGRKSTVLMSPNTIRSYMRDIETFLTKAGPPGRGNRDALGIISVVPWAKPPKAIHHPPRFIEEEMLNSVYLAAAGMEAPRFDGIKPPAWWRALLVFVYNTALRRGALFRLRMSDLNWDGSIIVRAKGAKTSIGQVLPLNETVLSHLRAIRTDRELVFPWPFCLERFHKEFHKLQDLAAVPAPQHFGLHSLRKTAATMLWEESPSAAQLMLGHTSSRTTAGFYVNGRGILSRAAERMHQPSAFSAEKGDAQ